MWHCPVLGSLPSTGQGQSPSAALLNSSEHRAEHCLLECLERGNWDKRERIHKGIHLLSHTCYRLILLTVFLLLLCGVSASCIKFCCRKKRLPVETFPRHPCDLTAIGIDSDSTAHSTVTSYSSWQYPPSVQIPSVFVDMDKNTVSPPAYSLYAMDLPPSYDEAVQMGKQVAWINQKLNDIPEQVTPGGLNPSQSPPDTINRDPATQADSEDSENATKEQPQI
ncbi:transmembrane protein 52 isoform X1 [Corvus kubaryi]|uniref:transmembrane protein 52 isoform X1 n=1 Tax=Corvus kubaryi TaxID=68294 RepID=UPI001C03F27F|nr:transmembrane protein 52 isoform X1 [Corvus kubaryi]